ncbi:ABC transporter permease [Arcanobacterium haemolyticum]|nr:ABC transporter permease [Arcanobacterium haemolyticum]
MVRYLVRRMISWLVMVFLATNMTYFLANFFLDPRSNYAERRPPIPEEQILATLDAKNLNPETPILERWWKWLTDILLHWDWGSGIYGTADVNREIGVRMWVSAQLVLGATVIAVLLGVGLGVYTASRQYKRADRIWQGISVVAMNTHTVVASLVLVLAAIKINELAGTQIFYVTGGASDASGFFPGLINLLQRLTLPTISLVFISYASYHMTQRSLLLDNIEMDYVRTARAKGLTRHQAIRRHALRTSIIPIATSVAFSVPGVFTGAVMTESIYAWHGMGEYLVQTIGQNDVHGVVATAAFSAFLTAIGAMLSDIFVVALDPRVRVS